MTQTMFKYTVPVDDKVHTVTLPRGAEIKHVGCQNVPDRVQFWALVFPDQIREEMIERRFMVFETGEEAPSRAIYVGTTLAPYSFVWHLFELPEEEVKS